MNRENTPVKTMKRLYIKLVALWIFFFSFFVTSYAADGSWTTPGTPIPLGSSGGSNAWVFVSFEPTTEQYLATWSDYDTAVPYYSIYDGTSWTNGDSIDLGMSTGSFHITNAFAYDSIGGHAIGVLVWVGQVTHNIFFSFYDGTSWTTADAIPLGGSGGSDTNVFIAVNPSNNHFVVTWRDRTTGQPYFSVFDGVAWSTDTIDNGGSVTLDVYVSFNSVSGKFIATWVTDAVSHAPYFSFYDGTMWTPGATIPVGTSSGAAGNVTTSVTSSTGQILATWSDFSNASPYYSFYNGTSWTTADIIPLGTSSGISLFPTSSSPANGQFIVTWRNAGVSGNYYSVYNGSWTTADIIPNSISESVLFSAGNPQKGESIATWSNVNIGNPFASYAIFSAPPSLLPPASFTVKANINNQFGVVKEYYNLLQWGPSASSGTVQYRIFRNSTLIATVAADVFKYEDHNRKKHESIVYSVASVDANGNQSSPITFNVN